MQAYSLSQKKLVEVPDNSPLTPPETNPDQVKFQSAYKGTQSLGEADKIASAYKTAYGSELFGQPKSAQQQAADDVKGELAKNAQGVLSVLDAGKAGKLQGQAYKDALDFASSRYAASAGFGQGGKALTEPELTILGGSIPVIQQEYVSPIEHFFTGKVPPQRGHVVDPEDTLRRKAQLAIAAAKGQTDPSQLNNLYQATDNQTKRKTDLGGIIGNAALDAKDIANGAINAVTQLPQIHPPIGVDNTVQAGVNAVSGVANEYNQALGKPLEGGDVVGRAGQHAAEHPLNTVIDLLPLISATKAVGGAKAEGGATLPKISTPGEGTSGLSQVGSKLRQNVRKIDVGAKVGGSQREAQVNKTLDDLGIQGTAAEQYTQIQPKMNQLSDTIHNELMANPKTVPLDTIENDFMVNLQDQLLTKNLEAKTAKKEVSGFLQDIYKTDTGEIIPKDISTAKLFDLKKKVNEYYQGVAKKIDRGSPLTDREKVISAARQTLDDIIAQEHPSVKQATLMQSNLFDAADSLYSSRNKLPAIRLFGNNIPLPYAQNAEDFIGRSLQKIGG